MRIRLEGVPHRYHEDHTPAKGITSLGHYNLVHKFIPMPQAFKKKDAKAAVKWKMMGKMGKYTGMATHKSQKQERSDRWSTERGQKSSFRITDGSLSSQEFGVGASISKVHRQSRTPRWNCERWFRIITQYWLNKGHQHHKWRQQKSWILFQDYRDAQDNQLMQYLRKPRSKWKMHRRFF